MSVEAAQCSAVQCGAVYTKDYLRLIGVPELPALTSPFDPGYDPGTVMSHLETDQP
jgi:hypothetical protein